jgi:hypothetical protein
VSIFGIEIDRMAEKKNHQKLKSNDRKRERRKKRNLDHQSFQQSNSKLNRMRK